MSTNVYERTQQMMRSTRSQGRIEEIPYVVERTKAQMLLEATKAIRQARQPTKTKELQEKNKVVKHQVDREKLSLLEQRQLERINNIKLKLGGQPDKEIRLKQMLCKISAKKQDKPVEICLTEDVSPKKDNSQESKGDCAFSQPNPGIQLTIPPVDPQYSSPLTVRVCFREGAYFSATLVNSNIGHNTNKFYVLQIVEEITDPEKFFLFTRYGRLGSGGYREEFGPWNFDLARKKYNEKLNKKFNSGYHVVAMDHSSSDNAIQKIIKMPIQEDRKEIEPTLHPRLQSLIRLIFDMKMVNSQLKEIGYDAKRMPLGKLQRSSILKGYEALTSLLQQLKMTRKKEVIISRSSDFYNFIPHDFGMRHMSNFVLDSEQKVRAKLQLLQSLEDIQVFTKLFDTESSQGVNVLDANYLKIGVDIKPLDRNGREFAMIKTYVDNTHASTHNAYRLVIEDIFSIWNKREDLMYKEDIDNKWLLWHGSRLTNFVGILSQGLRIAPKQAPVTGYMFGKGIYFADIVSKSANYCFANRINPIGCLLLCEVALGEPCEKYYADYYGNLLPPGKHSVKGVGKESPEEGEYFNHVYVPNGKPAPTGITNTSLLYNQYVVYDTRQVKCRYLLKVRFVFK